VLRKRPLFCREAQRDLGFAAESGEKFFGICHMGNGEAQQALPKIDKE